MSDRRKKSATKNKIIADTAAIIIHVLIIGAMIFNFTSKPKTVQAFDADEIDVVKATTIDESQIKQQQDKIKQKDIDKKRLEESEKKRLEKLKEQAALEKKRIEDLKKQQKDEQDKAQELEKQRKEIALKREKEKKQAEAEKKKREKELAERKKKELADKKKLEEKKKRDAEKARLAKIEEDKKKAEEQARIDKEKQEQEKQKQEAQERFAQQLAAEEARQRSTTLVAKYAALVTKAINEKRTIAPDFASSLVAKLNIKLSPSGRVESVSIVESSGNGRYDRDAETAVRNASPLPIPSVEEDEVAHKTFQDITLNIRMPDA